jgi:integrase
MANKKRNNKKKNLRQLRGKWYYRLYIYVNNRIKEELIPLYCDKKSDAIMRGKIVRDNEEDIKSGVIQKFQYKEYFEWMNDKGTSELIVRTLQDTINDYLVYRKYMVMPKTYKRDKSALNQFLEFVGYTKAVEELSYRDFEGANGLIQHLRNKGCSDVGINTSLAHIKVYLNWLYEKEKIISEPIKFKLLKKGVQLYHYFNESETNQIYHYIDENGIDSCYKRCFHFYNQTGMRPTEPFIGELIGDWYIINGDDRKNGIPMQMYLNDELKAILLEMKSFRDSKAHCKDAIERVLDIFSRTLGKIVRALGLTGKRLTLYSFRHSFAIRRITMTNGNVFDVMKEMGHTNTQTTMGYLRFPIERRLDDFPSLHEYIQKPQKMQKKVYSDTKNSDTIYSSIPKLSN